MKKLFITLIIFTLCIVCCDDEGCDDDVAELSNVSFNPGTGSTISVGSIITVSFDYLYDSEDDNIYVTLYAKDNNGNSLYLVTKKLRKTGSSYVPVSKTLEFEVDNDFITNSIYAYPYELNIALETLNSLMEATILDESTAYTYFR